jgi:prophage regulatory protein
MIVWVVFALQRELDGDITMSKIGVKKTPAKYSGEKAHSELRFLRQKAVTELTGIPRPTLYYLMSKGMFPKTVSIGVGCSVAWIESEVHQWMKERVKERDD